MLHLLERLRNLVQDHVVLRLEARRLVHALEVRARSFVGLGLLLLRLDSVLHVVNRLPCLDVEPVWEGSLTLDLSLLSRLLFLELTQRLLLAEDRVLAHVRRGRTRNRDLGDLLLHSGLVK